MAVAITGTRIAFNESNDSIVINCPIKEIQYVAGTAANLKIDGISFYLGAAYDGIKFHSVNGYPGVSLGVGTLKENAPLVVNISKIGDVLNPNYFKEDIRNWNGQGATAVAQASEAEAAPTAAKATRSKKAEVTE